MASTPTPRLTESVMLDTLMNYLVSMARTVESAMNRALDAIVSLDNPRTAALPGEVFLLEPRINEMEIVMTSMPSGCFAKALFPRMDCA